MPTLPVLGAAMTIKSLETLAGFMKEKPRDLEIQDFREAKTLMSDWSPLVEKALKLLDGHEGRLGIHGPFFGFPIDSHDPDIRAVVNRRMHQALDVCEALKATHMVVHSPFTTWSFNNMPIKPGALDKIIGRCHQVFDDVVSRAGDLGLTIVIENIEDKDPSMRRKVAESFKSDAMAVSLDTGHAYYAHGSTGSPPIDYYVRDAGNFLKHVHLQDADGYGDRHWSLGEGNILWHPIFAELAKLESDPRLIIEIKDHSKIPASVAHLEKLGLAQ